VTKRPRREIVDGQQRISTIASFVSNEFALGRNAREYDGKHFDDLDDEVKENFWSYAVAVDVIRNADRPEILQMFRRMNAFTLPLNEAEKRHSEFFGEFKDWVNLALDTFGSLLIDWDVLTSRQVVRMADAEFVADLALAVEEGIVSTSPTKLRALYKKYDKTFDQEAIKERISGALEVTLNELSGIRNSYMVKPHVFHSLICALIHNRYGLIGAADRLDMQPIGAFHSGAERAVASLRSLAAAYEERDLTKFPEFVQAASEGGNRSSQRIVRIRWLCRALRGEFA
jgi:hypothetical protein